MWLITIPKDAKAEDGKLVVEWETGVKMFNQRTGESSEQTDRRSFFEWLELLCYDTPEIVKGGAKGARRLRKLQATIDEAEAVRAEVLKLEDADYEALKKTHLAATPDPRLAVAHLPFYEAFEEAVEQKGPATPAAPAKPAPKAGEQAAVTEEK